MANETSMHEWMRLASSEEQAWLCHELGTTRQVLYQYSNGHRKPSVARAAEIEVATQAANRLNPVLPVVCRTQLVVTCAKCPLAHRANIDALV